MAGLPLKTQGSKSSHRCRKIMDKKITSALLRNSIHSPFSPPAQPPITLSTTSKPAGTVHQTQQELCLINYSLLEQ